MPAAARSRSSSSPSSSSGCSGCSPGVAWTPTTRTTSPPGSPTSGARTTWWSGSRRTSSSWRTRTRSRPRAATCRPGLLLWGPPGTGKTLMAEAVAGETGRPYVFVDPGAFTNMFMGIGILKVKLLFRKLRKLALRYGGVIVFFDEADALGNRGLRWPQAGPGGGRGMGHARRSAAVPRRGLPRVLLPVRGHPRRCSPARRMRSGAEPEPVDAGRNRFIMGGMAGGGRRDGHAAGAAHRAVRAEEAARHHQPGGPADPRHAAEAAAQVPDPGHDGHEHAGGPGRGAAAARAESTGSTGWATRARPAGCAPTRDTSPRSPTSSTPEQIDKLATITPYATGATIKDLVNEALIIAIRDGREIITWKDVMRAKQLKDLGPPEDVEYIERERHAVAVHEACHAVVAFRTRRHMEIDIATIEKGSDYLGMVASIPPEDQFTRLAIGVRGGHPRFAGLAGRGADVLRRRLVVRGVRRPGVGHGGGVVHGGLLGHGLHGVLLLDGAPAGGRAAPAAAVAVRRRARAPRRCCARAGRSDRGPAGRAAGAGRGDPAREPRLGVLAVAHALETHKTLSGEDVEAVLNGRPGIAVDGAVYRDPAVHRAAGGVPRGGGRRAPRPHRGAAGDAGRRAPGRCR